MSMQRVIASTIVILVFVVTALFAVEHYSDAQEPATCPPGTELAADGTTCLSPAVDDNVVTTTSCLQGVLSEDGTMCIVPRLDADPSPVTQPIDAPIPTFTG